MIIGLLLFLSTDPATPLGDSLDQEWVHERRTAEEPLPKGARLVVVNPHGDIRIRGHEKGTVYWIANIQKRETNPAEATVTTRLEDGRYLIEVDFPAAKKDARKPPRRVDLTLVVPELVDLDATVDKGTIEVKGVHGHLRARAEIGDMTIKTKGSVDITHRQGSIDVTMLSRSWDKGSTIRTTHGTTRLFLDEESDGAVRIVTNGKITTDFTTHIDAKPKSKKKTASITLGEGGPAIEVTASMSNVEVISYYR